MGKYARSLQNFWGQISSIAIAVVMAITFVAPFSDTNQAQAADLSQFNAGNIISDSLFFDGTAMNESQVQAFLNSKVPNCTINNGEPSHAAGATFGSTTISSVCLKNFTQQTPSMSAQAGSCSAYTGASSENAASIIAKVGRACNVSQKVLLVLLEKEQSLVSDSWPTVKQINQATGFACYDNGQPCVQDYAGFFYQVWSAARQLQRYGSSPFTWYPVGQTSNVAYQANRPDCGTKSVFIANRATAALYYYTPYTPNAAALAAGYGIGDSCSAYGNRNFYQLYVDWFGPTQGTPGSNAISDLYASLGGNGSMLGAQASGVTCGLVNGGCYARFSNGFIFYNPSYGAVVVNPNIRTAWSTVGNENGALGYPINSSDCTLRDGGCWQTFEKGLIFWSSNSGSHFVLPSIRSGWNTLGNENGFLAFPTSDTMCGLRDSGCWQVFQGGYIFSSNSSGTHAVRPEVRALWSPLGNENGVLGYPTSDPSSNTNTYTQTFQGGTVTVTNGTARLTSANDPWLNAQVTNEWLGSAGNAKRCDLRDSGCWQIFQGGYIFSSNSSGTHAVRPEVRALWSPLGNENGVLGYPTSDPSSNTNTYTQTFQGGTVTVTNGTARLTSANDPWLNAQVTNEWLGSAGNAKRCDLRDSGCWQIFQGGYIFSSNSSGTHAVRPEVRALWSPLGNENGVLGYPTSDPSSNTNTYTQTFQGGTVTVTNGTARLTSANDPFLNASITNDWLGLATNSKRCDLRDNGCWQTFQGGYIFSSNSSGTHYVKPEVRRVWELVGNENGTLGYPTSDPSNNTNNYTQTFQGGTVTVTNGSAQIR